ncbi:MAG: divergent polysaccharide deacetylase family protein [Elusimicrobia bacterium]|nr:divergent polysaccharide deacetylase family protein [Elusimicrobiota bacterium]
MSNKFGDTILISLLALCLPAWAGESAPAKPRIAVVLDDFALTYKKNVKDEAWEAVKWPVTFAVMPTYKRNKYGFNTVESAKRLSAAGHEVIIHFPFDPFLKLELPKDRVSERDLAEVRRLLAESLRDMPAAKGINNHRSYGATKNRPLMDAFMKELKGKGLYFLDSHVSPKSVAGAEARKAGFRVAVNDIFLESPPRYDNKPFCEKIMRQVAAMARKRGSAVVIGHHYFHGTYDCLQEMVPHLQAEGFEFVFASQLAK